MELRTDAVSTIRRTLISVPFLSKGRINEDLLKEMIQDLEKLEIISIIFLMTNEKTDISRVIELLEEDPPRTKFFELSHEDKWEEKLLEVLIIIENINIIKKLGYNEEEIEEMKRRFACVVHNVTPNLNRVIKSLYFLCKELESNQVNKLIEEINKKIKPPIEYQNTILYLECHILHWLEKKYITINEDNPNLNNLINNLKTLSIEVPFNFEDWKTEYKNCQDSSQVEGNDSFTQLRNFNGQYSQNEVSNVLWSNEHQRLCIIINEINFQNKEKCEKRLGSEVDEKNLDTTFKGCNFDIKIHRDFTKKVMMDFLESLETSPEYRKYTCIFMCILSHGSEGEIIFTDGKTILIKTIEEKFCCSNLKDIFKFLILQSCQGKKIGIIDTIKQTIQNNECKLQTDGPSPLDKLHYGAFQATIDGFAAFRHIEKGSIFIQDVCDVLRERTPMTPISVTDWAQKVRHRMSNRREPINENEAIVQIPHTILNFPVDYIIPNYQKKS